MRKQIDCSPLYTHAALRLERNIAEGLRLNGTQVIDLQNPSKCYDSFVILRHRKIAPDKRRKIKVLDRALEKNYGMDLIYKLAWRYLTGKKPNRENLSFKNEYTCSSRIALMYDLLRMDVLKGVDYSQVIPQHFIEGENFEITDEWSR